MLASALLIAAVPHMVLAADPADKIQSAPATQYQVPFRGADIQVEFVPDKPELRHQLFLDWLNTAATAVSAYYGKFPVNKLLVRLKMVPGGGMGFSTADADHDRGVVEVRVGEDIDAAALKSSWVATHEMVHLAFPMVPRPQSWVAEGQATYIEPLARLQAGDLTREQVWGDLAEHLPRGLPQQGDGGLNGSRTIHRVYWGGALYFLLADIELRKRSNNQKGLQDALRAVVRDGGNATCNWTVSRALKKADRATGTTVLEALYDKMSGTAYRADLDDLWRQLGVVHNGSSTTFDDHAPLAAVRMAIEKGSAILSNCSGRSRCPTCFRV